MASDYDWSLPAASSGSGDTSAWNSGNYSFGDSTGGASYSGSLSNENVSSFDFSDTGDWFVDSTSSDPAAAESSWLSDTGGALWDWLKSPQGTNVTAGAIKGLMSVWQQDLADRMNGKAEDKASDAELRDARVKVHNASINQPMDMGLIKFKR